MIKPISYWLAWTALVALLGRLAHAAPAPGTLGAALSTASTTAPVIAVGVDAVPAPAGGVVPPAGQSADAVAAAFGYATHPFGSAIAVGPATLPAIPDPSAGDPMALMDDAQLLTLFAASLDQSQWDLFRSANGIGLSDLNGDDQVALFRAFFRPGTMNSTVNYTPDEDVPIDQKLRGVPEVTKTSILTDDEIAGARLRLGLRPAILLPLAAGVPPPPGDDIAIDNTVYIDSRVSDDPQAPAYLLAHTSAPAVSTQPATQPNQPKQDDLDTGANWAKAPITPRSGETVADLLNTVKSAGAPEIYANPQFETLTLTVAGSGVPIPAGDLLRSIAFSVGGAYRKVGDVYDLTFDMHGAGALWVQLADATAAAAEKRDRIVAQAVANEASPRSSADLSPTYSTLGMSADQMNDFENKQSAGIDTLKVSYTGLTPPQRDYADRALAKARALLGPDAVDTRADLRVAVRPYLQVILPSVNVTAEVDARCTLTQLFGTLPSVAAQSQTAASGPLPASIAAYKRRAVIADLKTQSQIDDTVAAMCALGLGELWLVQDKPSAGPANPSASLTEYAVSTAKDHAIKVSAYVDALDWGDSAAADLRDLTVSSADRVDASPLPSGGQAGAGSANVFVSPVVPAVKTAALANLAAVDTVDGLSAIVIGSATPPGYGAPESAVPPVDVIESELGYTVAARQEFIRKTHADPIDVLPPSPEPFDTALRARHVRSVDDALYRSWAKYRHAAAESLAKALVAAAAQRWPALPVLTQDRDRSTNQSFFSATTIDSDSGSAAGVRPPVLVAPADLASDPGRLQSFLDAGRAGGSTAFVIDLRHVADPVADLNKLAGN